MGDAVRVAVAARAVIGASVRIYLFPVAGLLAGAGLAQVLAGALVSPEAGANAAGLGGIVGAVVAVLISRRVCNRPGRVSAALPTVERILPGAGEPPRADC